jgi:hypothetical protein
MTSFASVAEAGSRTCEVPLPVAQLLFCVSDLQVRPIVGNKKIENVPMSAYDAAALPFEHADTPTLESKAPEELETFFSNIHRALGGKSTVAAKVVMLACMERWFISSTN